MLEALRQQEGSHGSQRAAFESAMVFLGERTEGVEAEEEVRLAGLATLVQEFLYMIGVFEVPVALVASRMGGDEVFGVIEAEAVGVSLEREPLRSVERGCRVAVAIQRDAAAVGPAVAGRCGLRRCRRAVEEEVLAVVALR